MRDWGTASLAVLLWAMLGATSAPSAPPVVKKKAILSGQKYFEQTWQGGDLVVPTGKLTVAERHYWFGRKGLAVPTELAVRCQLAASGEIESHQCDLDGEDNDPFRGSSLAAAEAGLSSARELGVFGGPPRFSVAKDYGGTLFVRWVRYHLRFEPVEANKVELTIGTLVKLAQLHGLTIPPRSLDPTNYPSRALREERGGYQTLECQVQSDYSIICRTIGFDPAENAPFFEGAGTGFFRRGRAPERLDNGQDSAGVRFQVRIKWAVPT